MNMGFRLSLIKFCKKKVSMTQIKVGSKDLGDIIDEGFSLGSCDIPTYKGGFLALFDCFS
jgi:hypothetical protein